MVPSAKLTWNPKKEVWKKMFSFQRGEDQVPSLFSEVMSHGSVGATPSAKKIRTFKTTCILGAVTFWPGGRMVVKIYAWMLGVSKTYSFFGQNPWNDASLFPKWGSATPRQGWRSWFRTPGTCPCEQRVEREKQFFGCVCLQLFLQVIPGTNYLEWWYTLPKSNIK